MAESIPGVVVRISDDTGIIVPPAYARYATIVGVGDAYRLVSDVKMTKDAGDYETIPTIFPIHTITSIGDLPGVTKYVQAVDYELDALGGRVHWLGADAPDAGDNYYITFTDTRPASAYEPILYFNDNLIFQDHGNTIRTDGTINDVSKGGQLALQNGSKGVIVLQLDTRTATDPNNPTDLELENAFLACIDKLERITDCKLLLVGMSSGILSTVTAADILWAHAVLASQPARKQERSVVMAMEKNTSYVDYAVAAQAYSHERMCVPAIPSECQVPGVVGTFDTRFACASFAGKVLSGAIGSTFYDEIITGITFTDNFSPDEQEYLVQHSVSPLKSSSGVVRIVGAFTTDGTSALTEDMGVQDIKDYTKYAWRVKLGQVFRNKRTTRALAGEMKSASENFLDKLIEREILADKRNIAVTQDSAEPRKYRVYGQVLPVFGVGWIDVDFVFYLSFNS